MTTALAVLAVCGLSCWAILFFDLPRLLRPRRLAATRDRAGALQRFQQSLPDYPPEMSEQAYRTLQRCVGIRDFPVETTDHLWTTLDLDQGTVAHELEEFRDAHGYAPCEIASNPIETVHDYVDCLYRLSHREPVRR